MLQNKYKAKISLKNGKILWYNSVHNIDRLIKYCNENHDFNFINIYQKTTSGYKQIAYYTKKLGFLYK